MIHSRVILYPEEDERRSESVSFKGFYFLNTVGSVLFSRDGNPHLDFCGPAFLTASGVNSAE